MLKVIDNENSYSLNEIGQLVIEPIDQSDRAYTVRPQDFSEFELEVAKFLSAV